MSDGLQLEARGDVPRQARYDAARLADHLQAALNGMTAAVFTFDQSLTLAFVSDRVIAVLGATPDALADCVTLFDLLKACERLDDACVQSVLEMALAATASDVHLSPPVIVSPGDTKRAFRLQISRSGTDHWTALFEDVTAHRAVEIQAIPQALRDPMTGLPNRKHLTNRIADAVSSLAAKAEVWMIRVDLDRFDAVNDTHGDSIGDALLKIVARRLTSAMRETDVVARLGGDDFALLIRDRHGAADVATLAKRLVDVLARPYLIEGNLVQVGANLGIASSQNNFDHDHLFKNADLALNAAKKAGCNTFCFFDPAMDAHAHRSRAVEINAWFQPQHGDDRQELGNA